MKYTLIDDKYDEYVEQYNAIVKKYENVEWTKKRWFIFSSYFTTSIFSAIQRRPKKLVVFADYGTHQIALFTLEARLKILCSILVLLRVLS